MAQTHDIRLVSQGHTFLEGPRWHGGDLYASDFFTNSVLRFPGGRAPARLVATVAGRPSGLGFHGDALLIVSMLDQRVLSWDGAELAVYADLGGMVTGPLNDMVVDSIGRCYVGGFGHSAETEADFGPTSLIVVGADGAARTPADGLNFPNGLAIARSGHELLVAETYGGRVTSFAIDADGGLSDRQTWAGFGAVEYFDIDRAHLEVDIEPDGLALDEAGRLWVADAKGSGIGLYERGGALVEYVEVGGDLSVYAAALGGADGRTLFLCCAPRNRTTDISTQRSGVLLSTRVG